MKTRIFALAIFAILLPAMSSEVIAQGSSPDPGSPMSLFQETELRFWDSTSTYDGYTLFAAKGTYLIDMEGYVIKKWNGGTNPRFLDNGNILDASKADPSGFSGFVEYDWDGKTVWAYTEARSAYSPHHDWVRIWNKKLGAYTTLYIANKTITNEQAIAAGANPANGPYTGAQLDVIVEVDMNKKIIWEWSFFDHAIQDFDATKLNYVGTGKKIMDYPGRININMYGKPLRKDWLHCNSIDYNDSLDQIVINSVHGEFYVIDHGNTFLPNDSGGSIALAASSKGDFLYRFGDPSRYDQGDAPSIGAGSNSSSTGNKQIGGSHNVSWIPYGLPGGGHFLIFNNGEYMYEQATQSYVVEVNPYLDASMKNTGHYVNPPDAGYYQLKATNKDTFKQTRLVSNQTVWMYYTKNSVNMFSTIGSSAQRLPNGNTLICSDTDGDLFEINYADSTANTKILWNYINPVCADGIKRVIVDAYPMYNSVFRAYRYTADHPALKGKTLIKGQTITGKAPDYLDPADILADLQSNSALPSAATLQQNYPNPFNPSTMISFELSRISHARLDVLNTFGQVVATPVDGYLGAGAHTVEFDARTLPSGMYFYRLTAENACLTRTMVLQK